MPPLHMGFLCVRHAVVSIDSTDEGGDSIVVVVARFVMHVSDEAGQSDISGHSPPSMCVWNQSPRLLCQSAELTCQHK